MDDHPIDNEIVEEYLPIFESLRRQALGLSDTSIIEEAISDSPKEDVSSASISEDVSHENIFTKSFTNKFELASSTSLNKEATNILHGKTSNQDSNSTILHKIEYHCDKDQHNIEKDVDKIEALDSNLYGAKVVSESTKDKSKPVLEGALTKMNKRCYPFKGFKYKHRTYGAYPKFSKYFNFSDYSCLKIIEGHIANCVSQTIPTLLIKDILLAKPYYILDKLRSDTLFELNELLFDSVKCRGTVIGLSQKDSFEFVISDGTGSVICVSEEKIVEDIDILPIIQNFDTDEVIYQKVATICDIERGEIVQVLGCLDIRFNKTRLLVKELCKEDKVVVGREIAYLKHLQVLQETYCKWKEDVANILAVPD